MNVVGYLRVSTDRQVEEGLGLEVQRQHIEEWASSAEHELIGFASDEGVSGSNGLETRLGLAGALNLLREGGAEALVVYRLDRLARDLVLQEQLLAEIRRIGADLFSTSPAEALYLVDDQADPSRKLIRQVLGAVSEYERAMVRLRLEGGRRRKADNGGYAGYGSPPFGYRAEGGELVPVESEQAAIQRIRVLRANGLYLKDIAAALDAEGLKPRKSGRWHSGCVRRIVARLEGEIRARM